MHGLVIGKWQLIPCSTWRLCCNKSLGEQRSLLLFSILENETISYSQICTFDIFIPSLFTIYKIYDMQGNIYYARTAHCARCKHTHTYIYIERENFVFLPYFRFPILCISKLFVFCCAVLLVSLWHFLSLSIELKKLLKCYYNHSGSWVDWWSIKR